MTDSPWRGVAAAATAMFCVGTLTGVSPELHRYPVYGGQALRYAMGAVLLLLAARATGLRHMRLSPREATLLIALAATGLAAFNVFIVEATRYTAPTTVATIVATVPIILAVTGPLQQGRRPAARVVLGAVIVAFGAALATGLGGGKPLGWLLALGALGCEVAFSLLAVPLLPRLGAIRVSAYATLAAVPLLLAVGFAVDGRAALRVPAWSETAGLVYLAVVVTAIAFFCWYYALPRLGTERAGLFSGFLPIGAAVSSGVLGTGQVGSGELAGIAVVSTGLAVGLWAPRSKRPADQVAEPDHEPSPGAAASPSWHRRA